MIEYLTNIPEKFAGIATIEICIMLLFFKFLLTLKANSSNKRMEKIHKYRLMVLNAVISR